MNDILAVLSKDRKIVSNEVSDMPSKFLVRTLEKTPSGNSFRRGKKYVDGLLAEYNMSGLKPTAGPKCER